MKSNSTFIQACNIAGRHQPPEDRELIAPVAVASSSLRPLQARLAKFALGFLLIHSAHALEFSNFQAVYEFNDPANLGADSSGKNNTLVVNGGSPAHSTSGRFGGALSLSNLSSMKLTNFPAGFPSGSSSYTIAMWIKPSPDCAKNATILSWGEQNSNKLNRISLAGDGNGLNNNWWYGDFEAGMRSGSFFDGAYHHVVVIWNHGSKFRTIAIDGIIVNDREAADPDVIASDFVLGAGFSGLIDNVMIANTALPTTDIPAFWNSSLASNPSMYTALTGALSMAGSDQTRASLSGDQAVTNSGGIATLFIGFDESSHELKTTVAQFDSAQASTSTFTGGLNSSMIHLVKLGRGTQILKTNQNFLTASTSVRGGRLELDSSKLTSNVVVEGSTTFGSMPPEFGGKGTVVGDVTLKAQANMVLKTTGILDIQGSLTLNNNKVRLHLPENLGVGTYPLCKFLVAGPTHTVAPMPEIVSGSFAPNTKFKVEVDLTNKQVQLTVTSSDFAANVPWLNVYPAVPGLTPSNKYSIRVRKSDSPTTWNSLFVFQTKAEQDRFPHGYFGALKNYSHSYVNFEMGNNQPLVLEIRKIDGTAFTQVPAIRPSSKANVQLTASDTITVTLNNPCNISVDIDGQMENAHTGGGTANPIHTLSIHANPFLADKPNINAPDVLQVQPGIAPSPAQLNDPTKKTIYFKPGIHHLGLGVQVYSDKDYYIPGDAIVYATFNNLDTARAANKIRIFGHGTISGERFYHWNHTPGGQAASASQRPVEIENCTNVMLEGVTIADSANNSILVASINNNPFPPNEVKWLKVFTWRVNGDGGGCSDNSDVNNCFMRTQDDGLYVNGRNVSDTVLWTDVNGTPMRMSALPNLTDRVFTVKNIDVIYSRKMSWSSSTPLGLPGDLSTATRGQNVVFSNINVSDPYPSGSLLAFHQNGGILSGIRFENVTVAATSNAYGQKNLLKAENGGKIENLNFYNLKYGNTPVTTGNHSTYFTLEGEVDQPSFTDSTSDPSTSRVSITSTLPTASEPSNNVNFTFTRTGSTSPALTVAYDVIGKATNGTDYAGLNGSVIIPAGLTSASVTLTVNSDTLDEGTENVTVLLASSSDYVIGSPSNATVNIIDGDLGGGRLSRALWAGRSHGSGVNDMDTPKAFDSAINTEWISYSNQAPGQFFQVDLNSKQSFNRIEITSPNGDHAIELEVVVSNDGVIWSSPIASVFGGGLTTKIHFPIQNARFFKLVQKGTASGPNWWRISDIKVFGPLDGRAWSPTSSHNTSAVKSALDGNFATRWTTNAFQATSPEQWFQVDMGTARTFDAIHLNTTQSNGGSYNDFPVGYQVLVSDTGNDWATQTPVATGWGTTQITKIGFASQTKRYVRIKQTGAAPWNYWSIVEFMVFPTVDYGISIPWKVQDIGSVGQQGSFSVSGNKWTLAATGSDVWLAPDSFQYAFQSFSGDTNISSKVSKVVSSDGWARAGVMIRESSSPSAFYAMLCWTPGNGLQFQWRDAGTWSGNVRIKEMANHSYLRITRAGSTFTPSSSADGVTWTDAVKDSDNTPVTQNITMSSNGVKGLIVCSHQNGPPPVLRGAAFEPITPAP